MTLLVNTPRSISARACGGRWYAASTHMRREAYAVANLERQGFEVFIPKRRATKRRGHQVSKTIVSFFPGYVFVNLDLACDRWRSVNSTHGVRALVMQGERPLPVPKGLIEAMQAMTDAGGFFDPQFEFHAGDHARVVDGPLRDWVVQVDGWTTDRRVRVLIDMMNGEVSAVINRSDLAQAV